MIKYYIYTDSNKANYISQISSLLTDLNNWFQSNLLNLNLNKTNYLEFKPTKRQEEDIQLKCDNISIPTITHTKFLGLIIDNTLSWNSRIDSLIRKMSLRIVCIAKVMSVSLMTEKKKKMVQRVHEAVGYRCCCSNGSYHFGNVFSDFPVWTEMRR